MGKSVLTFIGKDSGFGEHNNSAFVEDGDKLILIDCGATVFTDIRKMIDLNKYNSFEIIITHLHNDHVGSLSQMILYLWFVLKKKTIVISKCENIKEYLRITGTPEEAFEIKDSLDNLEFIKTEHTKYLDSYGFKARFKDKNVVYSGDTSIIYPFLPSIENCDELYIDVSKNGGAHLKIDEVLPKLEEIKNKGTEIYLMHIDDKEYIRNAVNNKFNI